MRQLYATVSAGALASVIALAPALAQQADTAASSDQEQGQHQAGSSSARDITCAQMNLIDAASIPGILYFVHGFSEADRSSSGASSAEGAGADMEARSDGSAGSGTEEAGSETSMGADAAAVPAESGSEANSELDALADTAGETDTADSGSTADSGNGTGDAASEQEAAGSGAAMEETSSETADGSTSQGDGQSPDQAVQVVSMAGFFRFRSSRPSLLARRARTVWCLRSSSSSRTRPDPRAAAPERPQQMAATRESGSSPPGSATWDLRPRPSLAGRFFLSYTDILSRSACHERIRSGGRCDLSTGGGNSKPSHPV